jgi:glucose/arabinose dehydrogenase
VASGVAVDAHEQIVLVLAHPDDGVEVSAFEVAVEVEFGAWLDGRVHASEDASGLGFEIGMKFPEVWSHVLVVGAHGSFVLEGVLSLHFLVHLEAAGEAMALLKGVLPR